MCRKYSRWLVRQTGFVCRRLGATSSCHWLTYLQINTYLSRSSSTVVGLGTSRNLCTVARYDWILVYKSRCSSDLTVPLVPQNDRIFSRQNRKRMDLWSDSPIEWIIWDRRKNLSFEMSRGRASSFVRLHIIQRQCVGHHTAMHYQYSHAWHKGWQAATVDFDSLQNSLMEKKIAWKVD